VTPERWRVVTEIFHAALERPTAERSAYLVEVCAQDPSLRGDVEALLAGDDRADVAGDPLVTGHAALSPGAVLGPYRVDALLDAGGMGEVYKARDTRLHRDVAIKVLPAHSSADVDARARFEREGRAIASLSHPNICAVFDVGHEAGHDYLVMELLEGDTLNQRLTRGAFPITAVVDAAVELADALELAHARGLIHRDLKPENIFVTTRGQLKILDFGLAKMVAAVDGPTMQNAVVTETAVVVGTIAYMSPEQLRGESLDGRTDLFSLGLVLYELATGQRAFTGATSAVVSAAILGQEPAAPRALRAELPVRLEEAILKLLEKDRVVRCQSAAELRADLMRVRRQMQSESARASAQAGSGGVAAAPPLSGSPVVANATAGSPSSDTRVISGLIRRHRKGLAFGVLVVVSVLGAVGYKTWRRPTAPMDSQATPPPTIMIQPLTFTGNATLGTIAPDGKFVAYVRSDDASLWVRQTSTGSDIQIVPPEPRMDFWSVTVTPDSSYVDFVVRKATISPFPDLWRVPFLGGAPRKLATQVFSGDGWSPDGRHMAFVRQSQAPNGVETSVVIADADASNERVLAKRRPSKFFIDRPAWSPDGSAIAIPGKTEAEQRPGAFSVSEIVVLDVATGAERQTIAEPGTVAAVAWLDATHVLAARDTPTTANPQLMIVDLRSRASTALTRDLATYSGVSLTADRLALVSTRTDTRAGVWLGGASGEQMAPVVPDSAAVPEVVSISNAGVIAYQAPTPDAAAAIWTVRSAESPHVVVRGGWPTFPVIAPQGDFIVYASEDPGGIYRVALDGTQITKLTDMIGGPFGLTPDGGTVLFAANFHLWSVPMAGGTPREIFAQSGLTSGAKVSPDGRQIVFSTANKDRRFLIVCDLPDCTNVSERPFAMFNPKWTPDGRGWAYRNPNDLANIWVQPIDGGPPRPLTRFTDHQLTSFNWSADGKRLAVTRATVLSDLVLIKGFK
jgi:serine/threonine protein kinase